MTGRCVTVTGKRIAADFFIASYNARPKRPPEPVCVLRNGEMCVRGPGKRGDVRRRRLPADHGRLTHAHQAGYVIEDDPEVVAVGGQ
jgi:hypothetical protein